MRRKFCIFIAIGFPFFLRAETIQNAIRPVLDGSATATIQRALTPVCRYCDTQKSDSSLNHLFPNSIMKEYPGKGTPGSGYKESGYTKKEVTKICNGQNNAANGNPIRPHLSNCAIATFNALQYALRERSDWPTLKKNFTCPPIWGKGYNLFKEGGTNVQKLFRMYDLGPTKSIRANKLDAQMKQGWPSRGDFITLDRNNRTGHQGVFLKYKYNATTSKIEEICFWSSNLRTEGGGQKCEPIGNIYNLTMARVNR